MANLNLEPGDATLDDMIAGIERGVLMETNCSWSIDDSRNKFQFGCERGRLIEHGRLGDVVKNPNYRGISATFWRSLVRVGDAVDACRCWARRTAARASRRRSSASATRRRRACSPTSRSSAAPLNAPPSDDDSTSPRRDPETMNAPLPHGAIEGAFHDLATAIAGPATAGET